VKLGSAQALAWRASAQASSASALDLGSGTLCQRLKLKRKPAFISASGKAPQQVLAATFFCEASFEIRAMHALEATLAIQVGDVLNVSIRPLFGRP